MPWCDDCAKYWAPSAMTPEGTCPTCGRDLDVPTTPSDGADEEEEKAPWHFKLLVVALVVYLGWRFFEMFFA